MPKMSRGKFYMLLFGSVTIAYIVFVLVKMLSQKTTKFEHFEDASYKYRLEVMKVFDLYLNRNPTTEEIDKYSAMKNEQDILTNILTDFNISTVDVDKTKLSKKEVVQEESIPIKELKKNAVDTFEDTAANESKIVEDVEKEIEASRKGSEAFKETTKMVCIPKESYDEIKTLLFTLQSKIEEKEF